MAVITKWAWVFGLAGVLALIGGASTWFVTGSVEGNPTYFFVGGAIGLILYAVLDRDRVGDAVSSRSFVYGSGSSLMVALVAVICVAAYKLADDHDKTWDLTTTGDFTLSDHTLQVVGGISEPVEVLAFYRNESPAQKAFQDLFQRYEEHSAALKVAFHDPLRSPRLAEKYGITSDHGTVILRTADGREKRLEGDISEEKLTSRLVLLLAKAEHRICWAAGHGEPDPDDEFSENGMGQVVLALDDLNYQVTKSLVLTQGIDRACEVLVIARPEVDWLPAEREALARYIAEGGQVMLLLEPGAVPELAAEMARYGIDVGDDVVLDLNPENMMMGVDDPSFVVLSGRNFLAHDITSSLGAAVVFAISRSVGKGDDRAGIRVTELLRTSPDAWGETDLESLTEVQPDPLTERVGEVPVMVVAEIDDPAAVEVELPPDDFAPKPGGRIVVAGDANFASNLHLGWGNNRDLFMNTIAWMVAEEDQIGERPEDVDMLEISAAGEAILCLISVFFVPGAAVLFAVLTLLRRRWL